MLKSLSLAAAVSLGLLTAPASAAPVGDMKAGLQNSNSATQEVARRCYWHRGHRHCRYFGFGSDRDRRDGRRYRHDHDRR